MNKTKIAIYIALAILIGISIWFTVNNQFRSTQAPLTTTILPPQLPGFTLKDTKGVVRNSKEWHGKILIVNFWATWCPPCQEEMPDLVEIQDKYSSQGVQVVGVAVDNLDQVRNFMDVFSINFPVLVGNDDAIALSQKMGDRISALPYTAIFDQDGKTLYARPGKITKSILEQVIEHAL